MSFPQSPSSRAEIDELRGMREHAEKKWKPAGAMDFLSPSLLPFLSLSLPIPLFQHAISFPFPRTVSFHSLDFFGAWKATREKLPSCASFPAPEATTVG
jgi:hypothetical protein